MHREDKDNGAYVNQVGGPHHVAISAAAAGGHLDIVRLLLQAGANTSEAGGKHGSALRAAVANGHVDVIEELEEHEKRLRTGSHMIPLVE